MNTYEYLTIYEPKISSVEMHTIFYEDKCIYRLYAEKINSISTV
jgi:hypothetical protein